MSDQDEEASYPDAVGDWIRSFKTTGTTYGAKAEFDLFPWVHAVLTKDDGSWVVYIDGPGKTNTLTLYSGPDLGAAETELFEFLETTDPTEARTRIDTDETRPTRTADADTAAPTDKPDRPNSLPQYVLDGLDRQDADALEDAAEYARALAAWKRSADEPASDAAPTETPDEWDEDEWEATLDEAREKADLAAGTGSVTTKTIDGRDYYYLQWREGDRVESQYIAPVVPAPES